MEKTVLITGASGGIGLELAKIFAREGYNLVITARSEDKLVALKTTLEETRKIKVEIFPKDLSENGAARQLYDFTVQKGMTVDVLVNNAGFGDYGEFVKCNPEKQNKMMGLNIVALVELTRFFSEEMVKRGSGKIMNVASLASFVPGPLMSVYYATKAFVLSFTEAIAVEFKNSGVSVCALCPGPTSTGFVENADLGRSGLSKNLKSMSAIDVAEYGYSCLMSGKVIALPGFMNKLGALLSQLMPRKLVREIVYRIQK